MIIDGHVHAAGVFADTAQIATVLDKHGVDKIVLCPSLKNNTRLRAPERIPVPVIKDPDRYFLLNRLCKFSYQFIIRDRGDGNAFVHTLAQQHPARIIQFYWLNPRAPDALQQLDKALVTWPIRGIKLHQACDTFRNDRPEMARVAAFAAEHGLPIFIHPYTKREVVRLVALMRRYPQTNVILAHLMGMEIIADQAPDLPNIYFDTSGGETTSIARLAYALKTFGASRLIFSSDEPFGHFEDSFARIQQLDISETQRAQILGGNLSALCHLDART
jgi:hypothetical protein